MVTRLLVGTLALLISSDAFAQHGVRETGKLDMDKYDRHGNAVRYNDSDLPPATDAERAIQRLYNGYRAYYLVKYCYERREGFALVYINDTQLEKARLKAMNLEEDATAATPSLDTNALWKRAVANSKGYPLLMSHVNCQDWYSSLLAMKSSRIVGNTASTKDF